MAYYKQKYGSAPGKETAGQSGKRAEKSRNMPRTESTRRTGEQGQSFNGRNRGNFQNPGPQSQNQRGQGSKNQGQSPQNTGQNRGQSSTEKKAPEKKKNILSRLAGLFTKKTK
jgi:hypothetical protein